jgi:enamine deaminase RidA (YjgF/YER057c/UK114 family)
MPIHLVRPESLSGVEPYAHAAVVPAGALVLTAGSCPLDADGAVTPPGDLRGQAELVMDNLVATLAAAGANLTDVAKTTVYVATSDRDDLVAAWEVVHARFGDHEPPSTLLAVPVLGYPGQLVEVEAVASPAAPGPG